MTQWFKTTRTMREVWVRFLGRSNQSRSPTARHRCDVSSELCCPSAKPRRWAPLLVTRFDVIPQVRAMVVISRLLTLPYKKRTNCAKRLKYTRLLQWLLPFLLPPLLPLYNFSLGYYREHNKNFILIFYFKNLG